MFNYTYTPPIEYWVFLILFSFIRDLLKELNLLSSVDDPSYYKKFTFC